MNSVFADVKAITAPFTSDSCASSLSYTDCAEVIEAVNLSNVSCDILPTSVPTVWSFTN